MNKELYNEIKDYIDKNKIIPKVLDVRKNRTDINMNNNIDKSESISEIIDNIVTKSDYSNNENLVKQVINWIEKRNNIISGVKKFKDEFGYIPKQSQYIEFAKNKNYYQKVNWFFDDYNDVLKKSGLYNMRYRTKFNEMEFIINLKKLAEELRKTPSYKEYLKYAKIYQWSTSIRDHMSWNEAIKMAGLEVNKVFYNEQDVIDLFEDQTRELGRPPTTIEFSNKEGNPNAIIFKKYFNSYNEFLKRAGYPPNHRDKYTEQELKLYMEDFFDKYGDSGTRELFDMQPGYPFNTIYRKRYGSWSNAVLKLVGIDVKHKKNQFAIPYISNHGDVRDSAIEGFIDDIVGTLELKHEHSVKYSKLFGNKENYNMDFFIENKYILEVAGLVTRKEYFNNGINLKEDIKKDYLKKMKRKEEIADQSKYKYIVIFKGDGFKTIIEEISKITSKAKDIKNPNDIKYGKKIEYEVNISAFNCK